MVTALVKQLATIDQTQLLPIKVIPLDMHPFDMHVLIPDLVIHPFNDFQ